MTADAHAATDPDAAGADSPVVRPPVPAQTSAEPPLGADPPERVADAGWRESIRTGLLTWLAGLVLYCAVTFFAWLPLQDVVAKAGNPPADPSGALAAWNRWDTTWYLAIADNGYHWDSRSTAFFPLYPMLVRGVKTMLPIGTFQVALLVSALACLVALILVHRLATEVLDADHARRTAFYLLAFPTGFYLVAAYNESLFIALAVGSLYCMRRGLWWWAGALARLASATRLAGVLLGLAFVYEYVRQAGWSPRRIRLDFLGLLLVPAGVVAFAVYCAQSFGNPTAFLDAQQAWFHGGFQAPWTTIGEVIRLVREGPLYGPDTVRNIVNLTTELGSIALMALAVFGRWRLGREFVYLVAFALPAMLMPFLNPVRSYYPLASVWRYVLECLPAFLVLARMGANRTFDRFYVTTMIGVQGVMIVTFIENNFVG